MKYFIIALLVTFQASATSLGKYRSTADGVASQKFTLDGKVAKFEKTSNYFDLSGKDYTVGIFQTANEKAVSEQMAKVDEYVKKFEAVDEYLKTKGSSFNDVAGSADHDVVIHVNDFRIRKESKYFAELDAIFMKLRKLEWKQTKGFQVSPDLKNLTEIDEGKKVKTSPYARDLYCQKMQLPTMCTFHGGGQIYVK